MKAIIEHRRQHTVELPFLDVTARAIVVRRGDGFWLGLRHHEGARYATPGGHMEEGESAEEALLRELAEEGLEFVGLDPRWRDWLSVDVNPHNRVLNIWYLCIVDDVHIGANEEVVETRWIDPAEDVWYPTMREKMRLAV